MIRNLIGIISALTVLLMLTLTNPGLRSHRLVVKKKAATLVDDTLMTLAALTSSVALHNRLKEKRGGPDKRFLVDNLLRNGISRTNYVLFSTTDLDYNGQKSVIGYGVLGNVYLNDKLHRALTQITKESIK